MANSILTFGKFKGQDFFTTPSWYQEWLNKQDWFKAPTQLTELQKAEKSISELSRQLNRWDGHSSRGTALYDSLFDAEVAMDDAVENERKYFGMNAEEKQAQMDWDYAEIVACNRVEEYYKIDID